MTLPNECSKEREKELKPFQSNLTFKSEMSNTFRGSKTFLPSIDPTLHQYEYSKRAERTASQFGLSPDDMGAIWGKHKIDHISYNINLAPKIKLYKREVNRFRSSPMNKTHYNQRKILQS